MSEELWMLRAQTAEGVDYLELSDFLTLDFARDVANWSTLTVKLDPMKYKRGDFGLDYRLGLWHRPKDGPLQLATETVWFVRWWNQATDDSGKEALTIKAHSANWLLDGRIVAYAAASAQAQKDDLADDMMKEIVRENLGTSSGTSIQRDISTYLTVATDLSQGPTLRKGFARRDVLGVLQELHDGSVLAGHPVFFDIVAPTSGALEFRTYLDVRGSNRTITAGVDPVLLSRENGTLLAPSLTEDHTEERNFAYAGGEDSGAGVPVSTAEDDARIGKSPFNRREIWVNASSSGTVANAIQDEADAAVRAGRPRWLFTAKIGDSPQCRYGKHWRWGDKVSATYAGRTFDCDVRTLAVSIAGGKRTITAQLQAEGNT